MLAKVGVRTWTRLGLREFSFQETLYMTSPRGASTRLVAVPVVKTILSFAGIEFAGRQFGEGLAKNLAALHDFKRAHKQAGAHVAGLLDGHVEFHFGVGGVGRGAAQILGQAGGARRGSNDAAGDGFLVGEHADAGAARARRASWW